MISLETLLGLPLVLLLLLLGLGLGLGLLRPPRVLDLLDVLGVDAHLLDLVLALPEDGHVVIDDGVLRSRWLQLEQDPLLLAAGVLSLVDVAPAVGVVVAGQASALVLAQLIQRLGLNKTSREDLITF